MRIEATGIEHGASRRAVRAVNQHTRIRTQRILFHQAGSVAEKWRGGKTGDEGFRNNFFDVQREIVLSLSEHEHEELF